MPLNLFGLHLFRPCIPGSAGHPWLSDSKIRFMEVAQRCVTLNEELKNVSHCESAIEYKNKENCTRHTEVIHKTLNIFLTDILSDPTCHPNWPNHLCNVDCINFQEYQTELMKRFGCMDESVLVTRAENLQKLLHSTHHSSNESTLSLDLLTLAFFVSYVRKFQKLPLRSLMISIFEMTTDPVVSHEFYNSLLPEVLSIPDHHQSDYILKFLKKSAPSDCYTLLCKLCSLDSKWTSDTYSVLEFLFDPCLRYVSSTSELSPTHFFTTVVNKFYSDSQEDSNLQKSVIFTNLIIKFLRNYTNYYVCFTSSF
ncbi:hypothetical protein KSF78_0006320 [Schistosoma japonicum]|nr:hypothetical protein KSF78_0006320 [Schistosoma japonicum]